jgi:hypothetical protein
MFSTPVTTGDHFYEVWSAGESATQVTGTAPSWVANPSITEERTKELEPHEPTRLREYGAQPGSGSSDALAPDEIATMVRPIVGGFPVGLPVACIDSSSGRGDGFSFALARFVRDGNRRVLHVYELGAFEGKFGVDVSFDSVVAHVAELARRHGACRIFGDQYLSYALESAFAAFGLSHCERAWTQPSKIEALATLRRLSREQGIVVEPGEQADMLKKELTTMREVLLPSKVFTVQARRTGRGHADRASLLLMIARLVAEGDIMGGNVDTRLPGGLPMLPGSRPMNIRTGIGRGVADFTSPSPAPQLSPPTQTQPTGQVRLVRAIPWRGGGWNL